MVKQVKHLRTHRKGAKRGLKFKAGSKPIISTRSANVNAFAILQRPVAFKKFLKNYLVETKLEFKPAGMRMIGMDPANVALIDVLCKTGPEGVFLSIAKPEIIGVNIKSLTDLFKNAKKDEVWLFSIEGTDLILSGPHGKFNLPLLKVEDMDQKEPITKESLDRINAGIKFSAGINSHEFNRVVSDASSVAESITFTGKKEGIDFKAKEDLTGSEGSILGVTNGGSAKAKYSIEYLKKLKPLADLFENINLRFGDNHVLMITAGTNLASFMFILAPRVDSDEVSAPEVKPVEVPRPIPGGVTSLPEKNEVK